MVVGAKNIFEKFCFQDKLIICKLIRIKLQIVAIQNALFELFRTNIQYFHVCMRTFPGC